MRIEELVERFGGQLGGDGSVEVTGIAGIECAGRGDATFAVDDKHLQAAEASEACCVIVRNEARSSAKPLIRCDAPEAYTADLLEFFHPRTAPEPGIHRTAVIDSTAHVDESATIGPHAVIGRNCTIGGNVRIMASVTVGDDSDIGDDTVIHPNTTIYPRTGIGSRVLIHAGAVIGADGFGFFMHRGRLRKWPHVGNVVIEDDVEIGANTTIDRAKYGTTLIQQGAKIDNLCQIAHNCRVGPGALLAAQVAMAGSSVFEEGVVCGGQVGIAEHTIIGKGTRIGAQSGVMGRVPPGSSMFGSVAVPRRQAIEERKVLQYLAENRAVLKRLIHQAKSEK